jgi:hypothetical protein
VDVCHKPNHVKSLSLFLIILLYFLLALCFLSTTSLFINEVPYAIQNDVHGAKKYKVFKPLGANIFMLPKERVLLIGVVSYNK